MCKSPELINVVQSSMHPRIPMLKSHPISTHTTVLVKTSRNTLRVFSKNFNFSPNKTAARQSYRLGSREDKVLFTMRKSSLCLSVWVWKYPDIYGKLFQPVWGLISTRQTEFESGMPQIHISTPIVTQLMKLSDLCRWIYQTTHLTVSSAIAIVLALSNCQHYCQGASFAKF